MRVATLLTFLAVTTIGRAEEKPDTNYDHFKPLSAGVKKADKVVVHEGLPHPLSEKDKYDVEKKKTNVTRPRKDKVKEETDAHRFYDPPQAASAADAKALTTLFANPDVIKAFSGNKRCGGFHPDYAIEWRAGSDVYYVEICYGCSEVKAYGPKDTLHADVSKSGLEDFKKVLAGYQKNRPMGRAQK